ncbi:MAG: hypothetical protein FWG77_09635 [Treponema sp.]|nr:hypothetical protein [Treponema sp.]
MSDTNTQENLASETSTDAQKSRGSLPDYPRGITFEQVWAALMEERELMEKRRVEFDLQTKENDRQMKIFREQMGGLNNSFGEMVEHLVAPSIVEKFNELGFDFHRYGPNVRIKKPGTKDDITEIDILLENGETVIAVEVKAKIRQKDVKKHIERMQILRLDADLRSDKRRHHGAIAVAIIDDALRRYILKQGFYLIEQTGDTVRINVPEGFSPREW